MKRLHLCFIIETGTDFRLIEGMTEKFELTLVNRCIDKNAISQTTDAKFSSVVGPKSRLKYSSFVFQYLIQNKKNFDHIIVQGYGLSAISANFASIITKVPTSMLVCSPTEAYYACRKEHPLPGKPFRLYEMLSLQAIAVINAILGQQYITLSQHLTDSVHQYGIKKKTFIIPVYGVDTSLFIPPDQEKAIIREKLGLPVTSSIIFFSSRIAPEKDSEALLIAFRQLLNEGMDLWLLHRSGGYRTFIKDAERYGVLERVIATDAVHPHKELPLDYQACDICIQSSRQEGLGFSPLEALASGVPVIASSVGGLRETIIDDKTGWSYPVGDARALAQCVKTVLSDPMEATQRALEGRKLVCSNYDRKLVFGQLYDLVSDHCKHR